MKKIEEEIQQKKFKSAHQKALVNFLYTSNWLHYKQQEFFKPYGITGQQYNILRILKGQHPKSISATEIKSRMLDRNSDVSRLLDRLELKNLIIKKTSTADKRATDVFITEQGLELLKAIAKKEELVDEMFNITEEEALLLSDLLDKCRS
ncbi:MarR family winged helix-turn-helix transcriptional regulator [Chryseosolibacter indicus]|uniref:MarR family transcriptional regulator n=1 Tax=Chryseosolibacter indicus TaxID=2782351 RepID=A0ABS5VYL7_9BACT|nr:MarR family transcriptional regulator [Chryseosolibacter indicus]MBT1706401.1 MarR family transcriptional regulator [Chryseosolibacter indicus]